MKIRDFDSAVSAARSAQSARQDSSVSFGKPSTDGSVQIYGERHEKWDFALSAHNNLSTNVMAGPSSDVMLTGTIVDPDDINVYGYNLTAGQTYLFSAYGSGATPVTDTFLYVFDSTLTFTGLQDYDDDGGGGTSSLISYTATYSGVHYIGVGGYPGDGWTGGYTFDAFAYSGVDQVGDTFAGAPALSANGIKYGWIDAGPDGPYGAGFSEVDTYSFTVQAGKLYSIELAGGADYESDYLNMRDGELDTIMVIYDQDGNYITDNDDINFPSDISSRIDFFATEDAVYYIDVLAYSPNTSAAYSITTRELNPADYDPLDSIIWASANNVPFVGGKAYVYFGHAGETFGQTADDGVSPMETYGWTAYEIQQVMKALDQYEKILGVDYQITGNLAQATFRLSTTTSDQYGAYFIPQDPAAGSEQGVGVFNIDDGGWTLPGQQTLQQGGYSFNVLLHEFGHAHGLAHPHDRGGGSDIMLGVTSFDSYGVYDLNQGVYTVMSYNFSWPTGPNGDSPYTVSGVGSGWSGTLSAFDIAALQQRYGVNNPYATGNTTYTLKDVQAVGTYYECIWDTGGKDTIKYDGNRNARIDLLAATLDYTPTGGGAMSFVDGIFAGFTIAAGVVIENASGGAGDDDILGNSANNELKGGAGDDVLIGRGGADKLDGGSGFDFASYLTATTGVHASLDNSCGSTGEAAGDGYKGIEGLQGSNYNDILQGSKNGDTLLGEAGDDCIGGGDGNDQIDGGAGNDKLDGGKGVDYIDGGAGNDEIDGGKGADTIIGGTGNDCLTGDEGKDTFVFSIGDGQDKITDFKKNQDIIDFRGTGVAWDELDSNSNNKLDHNDAFVNVVSGHTYIDYGAAAGGPAGVDTLQLCDVKDLKEDSFLFG